MRFRFKILLSIWGVVLSLLVITFFIINYGLRSRIEENFAQELRSNYSTLSVFMGLQSEILLRGCQVIAESPRLRAVTELRDPRTAFQLSQEIIQTTLNDLFVVTDLNGRPLVQILNGRDENLDISTRGSIQQALHRQPVTDVWPVGPRVYRVASTPIMVDHDLIGTLTIGFDLSSDETATLKRTTNSELVLLRGPESILATLHPASLKQIRPALAKFFNERNNRGDDSTATITLPAGEETYLAVFYDLSKSYNTQDQPIGYLILKPVEQELNNALSPILATFGFVSLLFLVLTTIIGHLISLGISKPISELVKGTDEVSRGNYDYEIAVRGNDELSYLAQQFGEMSKKLKEKISELDQLNKDLLARNRDLDATLRQLKEAQEELVKSERLAATGKLTAQLAHEINNPIHNIQSCLKTTLTKLPEGFEGRELVEVAFDEITRMSKLTRQMLDVYRTSLVREELQPVDIHTIINEVLTASRPELESARISVRTAFGAGQSFVAGVSDKLKQVFLNIILNAKDAMPRGGTLTIRTSVEADRVKINFSDTGIGIPKEHLHRVFDAFFTTKGKVSGVGLGLSVSYGIIQQHRGSITVSSNVGEGSTFVVTLPTATRSEPVSTVLR